MSKALKLFESTLERSTNVFWLAQHWHDDCPVLKPSKEHKSVYEDMARAGVVLAVAAMDAYFTRRFTEVLVPFIKARGATDELVTLLQAAGLDTRQALELLAMDVPYRRIRTLVESHLDRYTTQRFAAVDRLFLCFGLKDLCAHAQKRAGRATLLRSVELLVERRHSIVHSGDHNKLGKVVPLDFRLFNTRLHHLNSIVRHADFIITTFAQKL